MPRTRLLSLAFVAALSGPLALAAGEASAGLMGQSQRPDCPKEAGTERPAEGCPGGPTAQGGEAGGGQQQGGQGHQGHGAAPAGAGATAPQPQGGTGSKQ